MSEPIDIMEPAHEICDRLGLEYSLVRELHIQRTTTHAVVYLLRDDGKKYLADDGEAAVETLTFDTAVYVPTKKLAAMRSAT